jgi:hypothetical protein
MGLEEENEDLKQAIIEIFKKIHKGMLDIPNFSNKTPLNILMENKNAESIVNIIDEANIRGLLGFGGQWRLKDYFAADRYSKEDTYQKLETLSAKKSPK